MELIVKIEKRVATYQQQDELPICGNTGDTVKFVFDEEWEAHDQKTARFVWGAHHKDVEFTGDTCEVPVISKAQTLLVGVYAGELAADGYMLSTTNASIRYGLSTRCGNTTPNPDAGQNYTNEAKGYAEEAKAAAAAAQKGTFKVVGTYEEECVTEAGTGKFLGLNCEWNGESAGGRWFVVGATDEQPIQFQNTQAYEQLLNLTYASTFITLHFKGVSASFASFDTDYKGVCSGIMPLHIYDARIERATDVIEAVRERLPYVTNTCFVEVHTQEAAILLVYLSDFVTSTMAYMTEDGTPCSILLTGYSNQVEE